MSELSLTTVSAGYFLVLTEEYGSEDGGQSGNRTCDTRIFSPLLYQLSYLAFRRVFI
jgi:hypothetical protein